MEEHTLIESSRLDILADCVSASSLALQKFDDACTYETAKPCMVRFSTIKRLATAIQKTCAIFLKRNVRHIRDHGDPCVGACGGRIVVYSLSTVLNKAR